MRDRRKPWWRRRRTRRRSTRRRELRGGAAPARVCRRRRPRGLLSLDLAIRSRWCARLQCGAMATTEDRDAAESLDAWRENVYDRAPERTDELFSTISGIENEPLSTPENVGVDYPRDLGYPEIGRAHV